MADTFDLAHLRTVVEIDESGGFGRAAAALRLSQPTVSQHVRALERVLGEPVVEKSGRISVFTAAGERLVAEARRILAVHDDALRKLGVSARDDLVIGSTDATAAEPLTRLRDALCANLSGRSVRLRIDRSDVIAEEVERGAVDLAIVFDSGSFVPGSAVGQLAVRWCASPQWDRAARGDSAIPFVGYGDAPGVRRRALSALVGAGWAVHSVADSPSIHGVLSAVRGGWGVAAVPLGTAVPAGVALRDDLPELGRVTVRLRTRPGLDPEISGIAQAVLTEAF
ncbi:LysR family transcriptional regulator [Microbacterium sp. E-13]|uniref:LysR family transcriptional regulator n=1 Tax=Microbacterium sp. E-13 TaxID=3404048 RepID=UPI003CE7B8DE